MHRGPRGEAPEADGGALEASPSRSRSFNEIEFLDITGLVR